MPTNLPPFLIFYIAALLVPFVRGKLRTALLLAAPILSFACLFFLDHGHTASLALFGYDLKPVRVDELSMLFGYLFLSLIHI